MGKNLTKFLITLAIIIGIFGMCSEILGRNRQNETITLNFKEAIPYNTDGGIRYEYLITDNDGNIYIMELGGMDFFKTGSTFNTLKPGYNYRIETVSMFDKPYRTIRHINPI